MAEMQQNEDNHAKRKRKTEMAGVGCLIQAIGLVALFFFPIGTFIGIILLIYGSMKSTYLVCSNCGNRLSDKNVKMCPTCKANLS
jgi:rubrerythrin